MIDPVSRVPPNSGAPESSAPRQPASPEFRSLLTVLLQKPAQKEGDQLGTLLSDQLRLTLLEALIQEREAPPALPPLPPIFEALPGPSDQQERVPPAALPSGEARLIQESAERTGIDPAFLSALRKVENGGPGREFGILSVPAPTYEDQARIAAETVQKNLERFRKQGGQPIDPVTGRYTEEFIRFFSGRYAPIGASNDPRGLNRFHASNLIRAYLKS